MPVDGPYKSPDERKRQRFNVIAGIVGLVILIATALFCAWVYSVFQMPLAP